jgi:hypothetical protein
MLIAVKSDGTIAQEKHGRGYARYLNRVLVASCACLSAFQVTPDSTPYRLDLNYFYLEQMDKNSAPSRSIG